MKRTLILSVVASGLLFAGSVAESNWKFNGQGVLYYQTQDAFGTKDLFDQDAAKANAGLQLRATNSDLIAGIGFGTELTALGTLGLEEDVVSNVMQKADATTLNSAYLSQLYLTYGAGNTSVKVGRQELPKALSPFAWSENWNVFKNTFDAALVVNKDLPDTVLVGAWVRDNNKNGIGADMSSFNKSNHSDGIYMLTAQNKSIADLTLTGSWYYGEEYTGGEDLNIVWADAQYNAGIANIALQGGAVMCDALGDDTKAFGAKVSGKVFDTVNASLAYSHVNDLSYGLFNVGGVKTPLYTQMILNQDKIKKDNDTIVGNLNADILGGNLGLSVDYTNGASNDYTEADLIYKTKVGPVNLFAAYVYQDDDGVHADTQNTVRVWGRYNF